MPDFSALTPGLKGHSRVKVSDVQTAIALGSGTVRVFASPMMVALMEGACVDCVEKLLPEGHLSLGTHLDVSHSAPTPVGLTVIAVATLISIDGRKLVFEVEAHDDLELIGKGIHTRVIVDSERFQSRLAAKTPNTG